MQQKSVKVYNFKKLLILLALLSLLVSCASSGGGGGKRNSFWTGYKNLANDISDNGVYGYSDKRLTQNLWEISYVGAKQNSDSAVKSFFEYRCSQIALLHGFRYYEVVSGGHVKEEEHEDRRLHPFSHTYATSSEYLDIPEEKTKGHRYNVVATVRFSNNEGSESRNALMVIRKARSQGYIDQNYRTVIQEGYY